MEEKQLDFNQPLLSVRRFSSGVAPQGAIQRSKVDSAPIRPSPPPAYKSELRSGPIRNPGTVPFQWEQSPGRPKDERKLHSDPFGRPPLVPKLPPGRTMNAKKNDSDKICKVEYDVQSKTSISFPSCENMLFSNVIVDKDERSSGRQEEKDSSSSDYDEAYLDAHDTLSHTESSLRRTLSSLSRLDGPDMEVSQTFSTDPQTLDIMMGRFLPAAKAMVSESPQHPSRKRPVPFVQEPPREVIKVVNKIKPHLLKLQPPNLFSHHMQNETGLRIQSVAPVSSGHWSTIESTCADSLREIDNQLAKDVAAEERFNKFGEQDHDIYVEKMVHKRDHLRVDGSYLHTHLQGTTDISSYQDNHFGNLEAADNSWNKELNPQRKGPCIFRDLLATDQNDEYELPSMSSVMEKTLYVDHVHQAESQNSKRIASKESSNCKEDDCSILDKHTEARDLPFQTFKHLNGASVDARWTPKTTVPDISSLPCMAENHEEHIDMKKCHRPKQDVLEFSQIPNDRKIDLEKRVPKIPVKSTNGTSTQLSLPLLKSPSESWLRRTLPTLSLKNTSKLSLTGNDMKNHFSKSPFDPKWETLVKTSKTYRGHLRFSEELLTPIPEA